MNNPPGIIWRTKYSAAYMEDGNMTIRYRFPFSREREATLLGTYNLTPKDRVPYYQTLSTMVERNIAFTDYLKSEAIPSIFTFEKSYQKQEDSGVICVYCVASVPATPITQTIFAKDFNALTALDVFLRLAHILRDINKTPISPVLRHLDMDDIYLTEDNKILLGGFYYFAADEFPAPPHFLADAAPVADEAISKGGKGNAGTDMQMIANIAWNIFSGLPWNCQQTPESRKIPPKYAPASLLAVLELGLRGDPDSCNTFRKQLMQCRKELAKTDFAQLIIPCVHPYQKEYHFSENATTSQNPTATATTANPHNSGGDKAP